MSDLLYIFVSKLHKFQVSKSNPG